MDSKTETVSDNELIAQFMDRRYGKNADRNGYLKYDSSWDHLMPVVEKIQSMGYRVNIDFGQRTQCAISNIDPMMHVVELSVYKAVVEFIRWYNSQSPATIK